MDNTENTHTILSICTGIRGLERGIERAIGGGLVIAAYVEIEAFICWNLVAAMESGLLAPSPIWTDLKTFPAAEFHGKIFGIIGGYPCQPFSNAGSRRGEDDPRHLWPYIDAGIYAIRPVFCFFENVAGHLSLGYESVRRDLLSLGYQVEEGIFSAEEVGAPHQRKRLFILAVLGDSESRQQFRLWIEKNRAKGTIGRSGEELANPYGQNAGGGSGEILNPSESNEGEAREEHRQRLRDVSSSGGEGMSNSSSERLEGWREQSTWEKQSPAERSREVIPDSLCVNDTVQTEEREPISRQEPVINGFTRGTERFPASPGHYQYDWEEPRTTKPGLGSTINGYNYREDFLRALGNGVVEQTAELAFRTLSAKFIKPALDIA
ncbi:DNA cytosine methyltransferase [Chitinophaga sp. sic0106]|uniref:DNA cytosine methyltransferase n=1 Tax=Chitinophaga sp. sic0106 TaxID=2854785 RepID=UPI001C47691D|nr:DNA cytosine methyltransferase [Chitinophaga sp. sic0106]